MYLAVTGVPFLSTRLTTTGSGVPTNCLSGVKVTEPSGATSKVPTFGTSLRLLPSSKVAGVSLSSGTFGSPPTKFGLPVCGRPCGPVLVDVVAVGVTSLTTAWYLTVAGVPLASVRVNSSSGVSPLNCLSGVKVTLPSASTSNLPTFGTSLTAEPLSNIGVEPAGNGTNLCPGVKVTFPS
ncbi:hypothetical protein K4I03_2113 [Streptococcus sanguinis]|nr:hypothetical protein [Streptococcus sanguinis]